MYVCTCIQCVYKCIFIDLLRTCFLLYAEILEALSSSPPAPAMTTKFTATQISTVSATISQQFFRSTKVYYTSSFSPVSVSSTTTKLNNTTQLPQGVLLYN